MESEKIPTGWEKIFAHQISDRDLVSRIHEGLAVQWQTNDPTKKWAKDLSRHLSREDIPDGL